MFENLMKLSFAIWCLAVLCLGNHIYVDWGTSYKENLLEREYSINQSQLFDPEFGVTETIEDLSLLSQGEDKETFIELKVLQVAFYLRYHKFSIEDPRTSDISLLEGFTLKPLYQSFPKKPVIFDDYVTKHCQKSFISCVYHINEKIKANNSIIDVQYDKPTLDQVHHRLCRDSGERKKFCPLTKERDSYENKVYCKDKRVEDFHAMNELLRYRFVTTSMYFMCWYTLQKVSYLSRIVQCDSRYRCESLGNPDGDVRTEPEKPFACALHSFCPDPCCRIALNNVPGLCETLPSNPCRLKNPPNRRECKIDMNRNRNFHHIYAGDLNLTCHCHRTGTVYNTLTRTCEDLDECSSSPCDNRTEDCFNTQGSFLCICKWGFRYEEDSKKCVVDLHNPTNFYLNMHKNIKKLKTSFKPSKDDLTNSSLRTYGSSFDEFVSKIAYKFHEIFKYFSWAPVNNVLLETGLLVNDLLVIGGVETNVKEILSNDTKSNLGIFKINAKSIYQNMTKEQQQMVDSFKP